MFFCPRLVYITLFAVVALSSGCSLLPQHDMSDITDSDFSEQSVTGETDPVMCQCLGESQADLFNNGLQALARGDYDVARESFSAHAEAGNKQSVREAAIAQALTDTLIQYHKDGDFFEASADTDRVTLIAAVLSLVAGLEARVEDLNEENVVLEADLDKREEALKRLRELTLGQPEG